MLGPWLSLKRHTPSSVRFEESDRKRMQVDLLVTNSRQRLEENCRVKDSHFRRDTSI
jgi:hypothetical protein